MMIDYVLLYFACEHIHYYMRNKPSDLAPPPYRPLIAPPPHQQRRPGVEDETVLEYGQGEMRSTRSHPPTMQDRALL